MYLVYYAMAGLLAFFGVHVVIWRNRPRWRSIPTLVLMSLSVLASAIAIALILNVSFLDCFLLAQFHVFVSFGYIAFYNAIELESPTLAILKLAYRAGNRGVTEADISGVISDDFVAERRLDPLIQGGFIVKQGVDLALTPKGSLLAGVYHIFRVGTGAKIGG